jgi:hypothetical protein
MRHCPNDSKLRYCFNGSSIAENIKVQDSMPVASAKVRMDTIDFCYVVRVLKKAVQGAHLLHD